MTAAALRTAVVVCCYTEDRWHDIVAALASVAAQNEPPDDVIAVVDHSPRLAARLRSEYPQLRVVDNESTRGLSGARNTGVAATDADIVAFLDDDAVAAPDWLARLRAPYRDATVAAVGGKVDPHWDAARPRWFPPEFDWVVGCTYEGHPGEGPVRNLIGANMSFRRSVLAEVGGFDDRVGRVGTLPAGCEETELCIRIRQRHPDLVVWYSPDAKVEHRVRVERSEFGYFQARCRAEGGSKAVVATMVGAEDGLASERSYALATIPRASQQDLRDCVRDGDLGALGRCFARAAGLALTGGGYLAGRWRAARAARADTAGAAFRAALVTVVDLDAAGCIVGGAGIDGQPYRRAVVLVRVASRPCGVIEVELPEGGLSAPALEQEVGRAIADGRIELGAAARPGDPAVGTRPRVTVVVATCGRADSLRRCIRSLLDSDDADADVLVVDNTADSTESRDVVDEFGPRVRWVRAAEPGLAHAHNRALAEPLAEIVAFTDDDVVVDRDWLGQLVQAFAATDDVGCVTGMIFPMELETPAQDLVERSIGYSKGLRRRVHRTAEPPADDLLFPYAAGTFGSGANMAFRTDVLRALGGFDPALGTGTSARGGDDLAAFFAVVSAGHALVYEPGAVVFHAHRREWAALARQSFGYGAGLTAYLTSTVMSEPRHLPRMIRRAAPAIRHGLAPSSGKNAGRPRGYPRRLAVTEVAGMAVGPGLYLRSRWINRRRRVQSR